MKRIFIMFGIITYCTMACTKFNGDKVDKSNELVKKEKNFSIPVSIEPTLRKGVFEFNSIESLNLKIDKLKQMNEVEFENWQTENANFTSLYKQYQILDEQAEQDLGPSADLAIEEGKIPNIPDDYFASILNKDGYLIVEDILYKFNTDDYQSTTKGDIDHLEAINWSNYPKQAYKKNSPNYGNSEWASFPPQSRFFDKYDGINDWPKSNGRKVRAVHTTWCSWYVVYGSAGSKVKMEKLSRYAGWVNIDHNSAINFADSDFRYYTLFSGNGNSFWDWDYYWHANTISTTNKRVNDIVLTYKASLIAGPIQHKVNDFVSDVTIHFGGCTLHDYWLH